MSTPATVLIELLATGLLLGFSGWVLVVQPMALVQAMPRDKFLGLQMRVVRIWSRTLVPLTVAGGAAAVARVGLASASAPALAAFVAALLAWSVVIPRALRAGGSSARADGAAALTSHAFLSEGGGERTRVWHRLVLVAVVVVLAGRTLDAYQALASLGASSLGARPC